MDLTPLRPYLTGEKFDNSLYIQMPREPYLGLERTQYLKSIFYEKKIIHIGYVAHGETVAKKIAKGQWLHDSLMKWTKRCFGIDIDCDGVNFLKSKHGITDAVCADITTEYISEIDKEHWDYAFCGETLEHIPNPVQFLKALNQYSTIDKLIISVPNILYYGTAKRAYSYTELVNSDHKYAFTPYNLCKTVATAGLYPEEITYCNLIDKLPFYFKWKRSFCKRLGREMRYPYYLFQGLLLSVNLKK